MGITLNIRGIEAVCDDAQQAADLIRLIGTDENLTEVVARKNPAGQTVVPAEHVVCGLCGGGHPAAECARPGDPTAPPVPAESASIANVNGADVAHRPDRVDAEQATGCAGCGSIFVITICPKCGKDFCCECGSAPHECTMDSAARTQG